MSETYIAAIGTQAIKTALMVAAPVLLVSMAVGLLISIFQALTQIQEQTLTFVPKVIAIVLVFLLLGSWMTNNLVEFTASMLNAIADVVK
jgi:flagellar biosynthetic protein FliQ